VTGVFATKWDFLFATVLIGVDRTTGVFSGSEPTPGQQMVAVWTSEEIATEALHVESWELRPIAVRDLLAVLPDGIGIVVDPERTSGMTASAAYVANLKQLVPAFPVGAPIMMSTWEELTGPVLSAVQQALSAHEDVSELHAFTYRIDDSPTLGCLAYATTGAAVASGPAAQAIEAALSAAADPADLDVAAVSVLAVDELPEEIRAALGRDHLVHRRRRSRPWRR
jgi:hypothetical protein